MSYKLLHSLMICKSRGGLLPVALRIVPRLPRGGSGTALGQQQTRRMTGPSGASGGGSGGGGGVGDKLGVPRPPAVGQSTSATAPHPPTTPAPGATGQAGATAADAHKKSTVETILQSTQEWNQTWNRTYMDLEASIMERIHTSNKRRFRGILLSSFVVITWFFATFGSKIKQTLTRQTADIAKETLENKSLQIQTQELARAVVQTILNDKEVTLRAAVFVREALSTPETKDALLNLLYDLVQHPKTQAALAQVTKSVIKDVVNDKETVAQVASLLTAAFADAQLKAALAKLVQELVADAQVKDAVSALATYVVSEPVVNDATTVLLGEASGKTFENPKVIESAKAFVADVVHDDWLQRESGDALWQSVQHAVVPGLMRFSGFLILAGSVALGKVILHSY